MRRSPRFPVVRSFSALLFYAQFPLCRACRYADPSLSSAPICLCVASTTYVLSLWYLTGTPISHTESPPVRCSLAPTPCVASFPHTGVLPVHRFLTPSPPPRAIVPRSDAVRCLGPVSCPTASRSLRSRARALFFRDAAMIVLPNDQKLKELTIRFKEHSQI